jgi:hypothetical protein
VAYLLLAILLVVVAALAFVSSRTNTAARGCCAPADPADDLRMRSIADDDARTSG